MPTNDFLAFANGAGANVDTQAAYAARTTIISQGQSAGVVPSVLLNKINRQASTIANAVAQYICDLSGLDALDNGAPSTLLANLKTAIAAQIDAQSGNYAIDTGAANAYAVALSPPITAWVDGLTFRFRVTHANTGASTINAGPGAVSLNNNVNGPLVAGDLPVGAIVTATYIVALGNCVVNAVVPSQIVSPVIGSSRNAKILIATAAVTATFTVDELTLKSALGGAAINLSSVNKTINTGGTGLNGMDTGLAPATGFVAIYAIYNPSTGVSGLLGVDSTSIIAPEIYGGANMPAGFTASALVSVLGTNSSRQFKICSQVGRKVTIPQVSALSNGSSTVNASFPITAVPKNAVKISGNLNCGASSTVSAQISVFADIGGSGNQSCSPNVTGAASSMTIPFDDLLITVPQTGFYVGIGPPIFSNISVSSYEF